MLCHVTPHVSGPCAACGGVAHPAHIFGTPEAPEIVCAASCWCEKQSESKGIENAGRKRTARVI